jgi:beta-phosphoglucomutase-like phosphatase (HAD superfamily)
MGLAALIFDVDGTLAETEELHRFAFNEAFAAAGLPWHWDQALYAKLLEVTGGKERIAHYIATAARPERLAADAIAALHADKTQRYAARVQAGGAGQRREAGDRDHDQPAQRGGAACGVRPPAPLRCDRRRRPGAGQEAGAGHL